MNSEQRNLTVQISPNVTILGDTIKRYKNRLTQTGIKYIADFILGVVGQPLNYIAVGIDGSPTTVNTTKLGNEQFRKLFTTQYMNNMYPTFETFFTKDEANFNWRELGLFAGGTAEKDTGILIARVVVNETKDITKTVSVIWEFRVRGR